VRQPALTAALLALAPTAMAGGALAGGDLKPRLAASFGTDLAVCAQLVEELDGRPGQELVLIASDGRVREWTWTPPDPASSATPDGTLTGPSGALVLPDPTHSLVALARVLPGRDEPQLLVADARGVRAHARVAGGFAPEGVELVPRYRQKLRPGAPTLVSIVQDVNADGQDDLVLPNGAMLEVWIRTPATGEPTSTPSFARAAEVAVELSHGASASADELSDVLLAHLLIPDLVLSDVNGDKRPDLVVTSGERRAWHLLRRDGSLPTHPDVVLDLSIFKDTTPEAEFELGRTLAGGDETRHEVRDLDGDGIPDHVLAHRRKVWVFPGGTEGPQFTTPSTILKTADDVTGLALLGLDDDARADLLLFKIQVPALGTLLRGLVSDWSVDVECAGYRNKDGQRFDTAPAWRSTIEIVVPPILEIARDPEALVQRFEEVGEKFRLPVLADFDGDGQDDAALTSADETRLDAWHGSSGLADDALADEALVRRILFEDPDKRWDLDRLITWLGGYAEQRLARITGQRAADARFTLRDIERWDLTAARGFDLDGDGAREVLLEYLDLEQPGQRTFDAVRWR